MTGKVFFTALLLIAKSSVAFASEEAECYLIGKDYLIQNMQNNSVSSHKGGLDNCSMWRVKSGQLVVASNNSFMEKKEGDVPLTAESNSMLGGFYDFVTGKSDKTHEGVQQFGNPVDLFYMPSSGYIFPTDKLSFDIEQVFYEDDNKKIYTIRKFAVNNGAKFSAVNNQIVVENIHPGKTYEWFSYNSDKRKASGSFTVMDKEDLKYFKKDLKREFTKNKVDSKVFSDLITSRVMYDWELFYDSRKIVERYK